MTALPMPLALDLSAWLEKNAFELDTDSALSAEILPRLAANGLPGVGVPQELGGAGGDVTDGVEAIAAVSERSLAAGFVLWGHRAYIEYLLQSPNAELRAALLPDLLAGRVAGATGLSNAMKFLSGLEELQVSAHRQANGLVLDGKLPWTSAPGNCSGPHGTLASTGIIAGGRTCRWTGRPLRISRPLRNATVSPGRPTTRLM